MAAPRPGLTCIYIRVYVRERKPRGIGIHLNELHPEDKSFGESARGLICIARAQAGSLIGWLCVGRALKSGRAFSKLAII